MANGSITVRPSAVDTVNTTTALVSVAGTALGRGAGSSSSISFSSSRGALREIVYLFDTSAVPANAEIVLVECRVKAYISSGTATTNTAALLVNTSQVATKSLGTAVSVVSITSSAVSRADLDSLRLRLSLNAPLSATIKYYGADLIVQYTYNNEQFFIKSGGTWHGATKVYKKVDGLWVEQTELASVVEPGVKYRPG